ncbi:DUF3347 domain-containing protein [Pedobacter sandarakinus]|uniref:DUF3347 domain-containing protein n=1 Tax=Pedobacter sandarakinus TaxID=353156 RepID=UPI0022461A4B|nr:DUF3347 domain-containing protein [Pedobacter sandarakinus]MCX2573777.1 DUF3347 domain-containing protein [Pedobacter sandarakinus]
MKRTLLMMVLTIITTNITFAQNNTNKAFNQLLGTYYDVKNALAADDAVAAKAKVKTLSAKVDAVPHKSLPENQHALWMEQAKIMKAKATELAAGKDLKAQRKSFEGISYAMIKTVKNIKFNNATVYIQHCPMAKASWLNEKEAIENPYYGSMMFDCGDVSETITSK